MADKKRKIAMYIIWTINFIISILLCGLGRVIADHLFIPESISGYTGFALLIYKYPFVVGLVMNLIGAIGIALTFMVFVISLSSISKKNKREQ